jgi:hypothetical protein
MQASAAICILGFMESGHTFGRSTLNLDIVDITCINYLEFLL